MTLDITLKQIRPETANQWVNVLVKCMRVYKVGENSKIAQNGVVADADSQIFYRAWKAGATIMQEGKSYSIRGAIVKLERDNRTILEITSKTQIREIGSVFVPIEEISDIQENNIQEIIDGQINHERLNRYRKQLGLENDSLIYPG